MDNGSLIGYVKITRRHGEDGIQVPGVYTFRQRLVRQCYVTRTTE